MRVLRHVGGVHPSVREEGARNILRPDDLRAVLGGGEGGDGEERREEGGGPSRACECVCEVQPAGPGLPGSVPGRGHERDLQEEPGQVR